MSGVVHGGPTRRVDRALVVEMHAAGERVKAIMRRAGCGPSTVTRIVAAAKAGADLRPSDTRFVRRRELVLELHDGGRGPGPRAIAEAAGCEPSAVASILWRARRLGDPRAGAPRPPGPPKRVDREAVLERRAAGERISAIAAAVGCSRSTLTHILSAAARAGDPRATRPRGRWQYWNDPAQLQLDLGGGAGTPAGPTPRGVSKTKDRRGCEPRRSG